MQDYPEVKDLLAAEVQTILRRRNVIAQVTIGKVHETGDNKELAEIGTRLTVVKDQVKGLIRFKNWSAIFYLHQDTATEPKHLRAQFLLAASGEVKTKKRRVKKAAKKKTPLSVLTGGGVDLKASDIESNSPPIVAYEAPQVGGRVESKPHSPVLLGRHKLPILEVLTSFVLSAGDIGGTLASTGVCRTIADTLSESDKKVDPRSLSPLLRSLVAQGIFGTKGEDYFLTPFGQLIYVVLSEGTCAPGEIDWGKVLGNEKLNLSDVAERNAIFAVMASEQTSYFTIAQQQAAGEVERLTLQLDAARRREVTSKTTLAQPLRFAKTTRKLSDWRSAIINSLID